MNDATTARPDIFGRHDAALLTTYFTELSKCSPTLAQHCAATHEIPAQRSQIMSWLNECDFRQDPFGAFRRSTAITGRQHAADLAQLVAHNLVRLDMDECQHIAAQPESKAILFRTYDPCSSLHQSHAAHIRAMALITISVLTNVRDEIAAALLSGDLQRYQAAIQRAATAELELLSVKTTPIAPSPAC